MVDSLKHLMTITYKLGEVCQTTSGGTPSRSKPDYYRGKIPWVKSGELDKGLILDTEEKITKEAIQNSSAKIFPKGTLLIALYGATIGKLAFLGVDAATNQAICGIYANERIVSKFLYYFLFFKRQFLIDQGKGGAQPNISQTILKNLEVPVPPIIAQNSIVSKIEELFSELDKGIENLKMAQQQLKVYRQSVLKWAFEGRLTNENVKEGELPEGWRTAKIGEIGKVKGGKRLPKGHFYSEIPTNHVYVRVTDFNNQSIDLSKLKYLHQSTQLAIKNYTISKDDVYISIAGTIGVTGIIPPTLDGANLTENAAKITELQGIEKKFLSLFLSSGNGQSQITINTKTTTQPKLSLFRIETIEIPLPNLKEQYSIIQEIENRLSLSDKMEESINQSLQHAEVLRQSILKRAFEGVLL